MVTAFAHPLAVGLHRPDRQHMTDAALQARGGGGEQAQLGGILAPLATAREVPAVGQLLSPHIRGLQRTDVLLGDLLPLFDKLRGPALVAQVILQHGLRVAQAGM